MKPSDSGAHGDEQSSESTFMSLMSEPLAMLVANVLSGIPVVAGDIVHRFLSKLRPKQHLVRTE